MSEHESLPYYNVPSVSDRSEAVKSFAWRNTPDGRSQLTRTEFERLKGRLSGICFGRDIYVDWDEFTPDEFAAMLEPKG